MHLSDCLLRLPIDRAILVMAAACAFMFSIPGHAQSIYSCVDANGKRITSDRPVPECHSREQRVLNADGSVKTILPPNMTADELAIHEARERQAAADRLVQQDALRRDRTLLRRYPNEAAHKKAREAALDDVRKSVDRSEQRLADLAAERKPLENEAEFYNKKTLPLKLRLQLDANDASVEAQRSLVYNQQAEIIRINALYDVELTRLKRLWAGAAPGSMGALPTAPAAAPAASATPAKITPTSSSATR